MQIKARVKRVLKGGAYRLASRLDYYKYIEELVVPKGLHAKNLTVNVPSDYFGHAGIDLRVADQQARLARWKTAYAPAFAALRADPAINTQCLGKDYLHNSYYPTPDAEIYAAMIRDYQPANIIEVGAGFSTRIARKTVNDLHAGCQITVIDPQPRADIEGIADVLMYKYAEDIDPAQLPLDAKTILFIDSSHITRAGGDVPVLLNRVVPSLPPGTLVQVHDIFIPYDYPFVYQRRLYTEQYVLQALLSHAPRYQVLFTTHYMSRRHPDLMQATFGDVVGRDDLYYGGSFWFMVQ